MSSGQERLYAWDDNCLQWYAHAVEYRSFHQEVAEFMRQDLPSRPSLCDVGCGIGALTLQLAPHCRHITAIDLHPKPISYLQEQAAARGLANISAYAEDFLTLPVPDEPYDGVVFCLAGGVEQFLEKGRQWGKTLFFVENATSQRSFSSVGAQTKETYFNHDLQLLTDLGIPHSYRFFTAPFGQVFTDRSDAEAFMHHYNPDEPEASIQAALKARLQPIDHPKFKLFMPNEKPLLMITIPGEPGE